MRGLTPKGFRAAIEAASKRAELMGSAFEGDTPTLQVERMARAVVDPLFFGRTYLPHYFRDEGCPAHQLLVLAADHGSRVVVRVPRGHAKSTVLTMTYTLRQVVVYGLARAVQAGAIPDALMPLWAAVKLAWAEERQRLVAWLSRSTQSLGLPAHWDPTVDAELAAWMRSVRAVVAHAPPPLKPDPYIQIISEDLSLAVELVGAIRAELERNPLLRSDWGDLTPCYSGDWLRTVKRSASDEDWESAGVRVRAFGIRQGVRGGKHGAWRPSLAIFDDPDGENTVQTRGQREKNAAIVGKAVNYGLEPQVGRAIIVGTPHHPDCIACRYSTKPELQARWQVVRLRAVDEAGVVLYPAKWTVEALDAERREAPDFFESELGDRPPAQDARPFHGFLTYDREVWATVPLPKVMAVDPSYGRKADSDFQAVVVLRGPTPEGLVLIHRCELLRIADPAELVKVLTAIWDEERPDATAIEAIALGSILESLLTAYGNRQGYFVGWTRIERQTAAKDIRIRGLAPVANAGTLRMPSDGSCRLLERQFLDYGDSGSKVDGPDCTEMAWRLLRRPARASLEVRHGPRRFGDLAEARLDAGPHDTRSDRELRRSLGVW